MLQDPSPSADWRIEQLSLVRQVSQQLVDVTSIAELCRRVTRLILETFDYYYVAIYTTTGDAPTLQFRASAGPLREIDLEERSSPQLSVTLGEGMTGWAALHGTEVLAPDVSNEPRYSHEDSLPETRSEAAIPLRIRGRVIGVLDVQSNELDDFTETDMLVLRALADNTAVAIERTRLYADLKRRADQLDAVAQVGRALSSILDEDKLLQEVVTLIREHFGYPYVHVFTVRQGSRQIVYRAGSGHRSRTLNVSGLTYDVNDQQGIIPWVARSGEMLVANDISTEPRYRPSPLPPSNTRSEMAVPIKYAGSVLGVLDLQSDQPNAFSDEDGVILAALAHSVAVAVRNASLYRTERWRRQVADSLQRVAGLLSADLGTDETLDAILTQISDTLPSDTVCIWLRQQGSWYLAAGKGAILGPLHPILAKPEAFQKWLDGILSANGTRSVGSNSLPQPLKQPGKGISDLSVTVTPLVVGDVPLGVLAMLNQEDPPYDAEDRALITAFASQAAIAIQNAQLYDDAQAQAWLSTVLLQVADTVQHLRDQDRVAETAVRLTAMLTGTSRSILMLHQESTGSFLPTAAYGLTPAQQSCFQQEKYTEETHPILARLRQTRTPILEQPIHENEDTPLDWFHHLGFHALTLLPLVARGQITGILAFDCPEANLPHTDKYSDLLINTAKGIAYHAAAAIDNIRLQAMREEEAYAATALLQISEIASRSPDLESVLAATVRALPMLVGASRCALFLWEPEWGCFRLVASYPAAIASGDGKAPTCYAPGDLPLLDMLRTARQPMLRLRPRPPDTQGRGVFPTSLASRLLDVDSNAAYTALPLSVRQEVFGILLVQDLPSPPEIPSRRMEILQGIAHQIAVTVQNDLLQQQTSSREQLEREMDLAAQIQQTFLPEQMPSITGWEIVAVSRPARHIGGDFYDFIEMSSDYLGVVIADVADKGLPASLYMALTRALIRATSRSTSIPTTVLERTNDLLVPDAQRGMFVTALFAILHNETGRVVTANAGHLPPLIWRASSQSLQVGSKGGIALGVLEGIHLLPQEYDLQPSDQLILFTDGVVDTATDSGTFFGLRRLQRTISEGANGSARQLLERIDSALAAFAQDTPPTDDCTIVVIKRTP
jgi:phosphoserine phosphatase RsbU/P